MRELRSKLAGLSGSRASMLIVRQLMFAMVGGMRYRLNVKAWYGGGGVGKMGAGGEVAIGRARSWGAAACLHHAKRAAATSSRQRLATQAHVAQAKGRQLETDRYQSQDTSICPAP